jgi:hypothetical protein
MAATNSKKASQLPITIGPLLTGLVRNRRGTYSLRALGLTRKQKYRALVQLESVKLVTVIRNQTETNLQVRIGSKVRFEQGYYDRLGERKQLGLIPS